MLTEDERCMKEKSSKSLFLSLVQLQYDALFRTDGVPETYVLPQ